MPRSIPSGCMERCKSTEGDWFWSASYCLGVIASEYKFGKLTWPLLLIKLGKYSRMAASGSLSTFLAACASG